VAATDPRHQRAAALTAWQHRCLAGTAHPPTARHPRPAMAGLRSRCGGDNVRWSMLRGCLRCTRHSVPVGCALNFELRSCAGLLSPDLVRPASFACPPPHCAPTGPPSPPRTHSVDWRSRPAIASSTPHLPAQAYAGGSAQGPGYAPQPMPAPAPSASLIDAVPHQQPAYPYFQQGPPAQQQQVGWAGLAWPGLAWSSGCEHACTSLPILHANCSPRVCSQGASCARNGAWPCRESPRATQCPSTPPCLPVCRPPWRLRLCSRRGRCTTPQRGGPTTTTRPMGRRSGRPRQRAEQRAGCWACLCLSATEGPAGAALAASVVWVWGNKGRTRDAPLSK